MNQFKYILGVVFLVLSFSSCSDFLDEEPVSEIPAGEMWKTARDAKAGINELYGLFRTTMRANYFYWGEFRSDNVAPGAPAMADQARVINNLMSTDEACAKWTNLYKVINQANLAINTFRVSVCRMCLTGMIIWGKLMRCVHLPISMQFVCGGMSLCIRNRQKNIVSRFIGSVQTGIIFYQK